MGSIYCHVNVILPKVRHPERSTEPSAGAQSNAHVEGLFQGLINEEMPKPSLPAGRKFGMTL